MPIYYIFNYENGGFSIISGDKRLVPILAFSETNDFPVDIETYPLGVSLWLENIKTEVERVRLNGEDPEPFNMVLWDKLEFDLTISKGGVLPLSDIDNPMPDPRCTHEGELVYHIETFGPFMQTKWDQEDGYNDSLQNMGCSSPNGRPPAGCTPAALAQIMKYHAHPNDYNWSSMNNLSSSSETSRLLKDLSNIMNTSVTCTASTGYLSNLVAPKLALFGYNSAIASPYNYSTVINEIMNFNRPVYFEGYREGPGGIPIDGHAWVCDGVRYGVYSMCYDFLGVYYSNYYSSTIYYLHMNWGWGGSFNAFYAYNNFKPDPQYAPYSTYLTMITNIKP